MNETGAYSRAYEFLKVGSAAEGIEGSFGADVIAKVLGGGVGFVAPVVEVKARAQGFHGLVVFAKDSFDTREVEPGFGLAGLGSSEFLKDSFKFGSVSGLGEILRSGAQGA